ncbi:aconitase-domain-containing protein [Aspergillus homomorphus CBS 101889]|uniref:Aconitate hydratase, mitochondrial n=1 Tax=Aspergillus homomorphus (strain CBS 101889) TaxID=1450537 RepID=A0A395HU41_ASPHC|nr:aconitase-domain-containing protein [Aspergillus homomorphus CBS 101889]RAL10933.1 aconitase-domain-containing protein [Aspergillus homomorphus CBS 101889]
MQRLPSSLQGAKRARHPFRSARHFATQPASSAHSAVNYAHQARNLERLKQGSKRPLTLTEKLLYSHLITSGKREWDLEKIQRGQSILELRPDRVACHDATATMALLQFMSAGLPRVAVPTTVHSDHLIISEKGAEEDLLRAQTEHREVYEFLSSASRKYGIGFWKPGSGIIHTVIFENNAVPGGLIIGTDSHTPNAGGLGMLGIGVGGADAVDAMSGMPWELVAPKVVGMRLTGQLQGWTSTKDIICKLASLLSVSGGKGRVIEFFGPGTQTLGSTAMATICDMSAEIGSTSCIFPYSDAMGRYMKATGRADNVAKIDAGNAREALLTADEGSDNYYDHIIELDLTTLEPHVNGPYTPDLAHPISKLKEAVAGQDWPVELSHAMVGSCTNSSYEDLDKARQIVSQVRAAGITKFKTPFMVSPGSERIRATAEADGILQDLRDAGAVVLSSSCGPCVGSWDRKDVAKKEKNSVVSSFNRNFIGRHDSNPATHSFVTSPELVTAFAYGGRLDFNPLTDSIETENGSVRLSPSVGEELPARFLSGHDLFQPPLSDGEAESVAIRIAEGMALLIKVKGKCTTDHISPAGPWYKYRGHLENISNNMLTTATNAFLPPNDPQLLGHTRHPITSELLVVPKVARDLKHSAARWCIVGDHNYGEGSSREHAALEPRYLGGVAVIARSFAQIHETNLKKQGMLSLTFDDPATYDRIAEGDRITLVGVEDGELQPGSQVVMQVTPREGQVWEAKLNHSYHAGQIAWLRAGSALNYI